MSHTDEKKEEMKRLVIEAISKECQKPSSHEHADLLAISKGLEEGRELELIVLTGGLINFSWQLRFKKKEGESDDDNKDDVVLYVKLTFGNPLLFPDQVLSAKRTQYEFKMMELFAKVTPYPEIAVTPYLYLELEDGPEENMQLLVTQFSTQRDEQFANIFIDSGATNNSFAIKLAEQIAALHNVEVTEPDFNEEVLQFFVNVSGMWRAFCASYLDESNQLRHAKRGREIGKDALDYYMDENVKRSREQKDCYIHGDYHAFNTLVEGHMKGLANESDSNGDVTIIDWEFCHVGPMGKDMGYVYCFPVACVLGHIVNGDSSSANSIMDWLDAYWEAYSTSLNLEGKDLGLTDVYRQGMGACAVMIQGYSHIGFHMDNLPIDDVTAEILDKVKESLGVLALEMYDMAYPFVDKSDATIDRLQKRFRDAMQKEIDILAPLASERPSKRRSSLLRESGRRVSDAHTYASLASEVSAEELLSATGSEVDESKSRPRVRFAESKSTAPSVVSICSRQSLALCDLKRKSIAEMEAAITNFDFSFLPEEILLEEEGEEE